MLGVLKGGGEGERRGLEPGTVFSQLTVCSLRGVKQPKGRPAYCTEGGARGPHPGGRCVVCDDSWRLGGHLGEVR